MEENIIKWVYENCIRLNFVFTGVFTIIWKSRNLDYYDESDCIESEFYREEHIGNAVVNNFKSPRRSSRLTRNNEDMSN